MVGVPPERAPPRTSAVRGGGFAVALREIDARQGAGSSAHLKLEKNTVLTAGTASRRGTRLSCVPSMLGSWEVKVFYPT